MKAFKLAVIGATGTARKRIIPALQGSSVCSVVALQARDKDKVEEMGKDFNIKACFTDPEQMLDSVPCDAVFIGTPPFLHLDGIRICLKKKKAIICEKPLARDYTEGQTIANLIAGSPSISFMVAHHLRHQKAYSSIKNALTSGEIGKVTAIWVQWGFQLETKKPSSAWKLDPFLGGGGTFSDNGIHIIDMVIDLIGQPIGLFGRCLKVNLNSTYDNEIVMMCYDDKTAVLNSSHTMPSAGNHFLIYGTKGSIEVIGGIGEQSIREVNVHGLSGNRILNFPPENPYRNEVEDFFFYYFLHDRKVEHGTTIDQALLSLRIIDLLRDSSNHSVFKKFGE